MIIELRPGAAPSDVESLTRLVADSGGQHSRVRWRDRWVFVVVDFDAEQSQRLARRWQQHPAVDRVVVPQDAYQLGAREFRPSGVVVDVAGIPVGDNNFVVAAGPCAVESPGQLTEAADAVAAAGAALLRGGAYKPRTSPYSFAGLGAEGLELLAQQRARTGLRVVTEVMEPAQVPAVALHADVLQIGTRNMQNFPLLREVGQAGGPVLLKRGMGATVREWLLAAEYVLNAGNADVILCERGIRTFEPSSRFTLDLASVPVVKRLSSLPVFVDPSHASGLDYAVPALALASAAVGADGILVDVHPQPQTARCDGEQAMQPVAFTALMARLDRQLRAADRALTLPAPRMTAGTP